MQATPTTVDFSDLEGDEFTGKNARTNPAYGNAGEPWPVSELGGVFEPCRKCNGTGRVRWGVCYACQGKKGKTYKQPAAVRAANRMQAAERRDRKETDNLEAFKNDFPAEWKWVEDRVNWEMRQDAGDFGQSLRNAVAKYGSLTEKQLAAVRTNLAKRAAALEARAAAAPAPFVSVERIEEAFASAARSGLRKLSLRLATTTAEGKLAHAFTFTPAPATGKNPGAVYVKEGEDYLGKVVTGRFHCVAACSDEQRDDVVKAASDPAQAAVAYGRLLGNCSVCGRELSDPESVARGIGPVCAERYGF